MKRTPLICTMLLTLVLPPLAAGQGGTKGKNSQAAGVEQQLIQIQDEWARAIKNKDGAALRRILADDWVGTTDQGTLQNKEQNIARNTSNPDVIESNEVFDMKVRVFGNTAVMTGGAREKGTRNGAAYMDTYRWTDVFVKRGGRWQAVASQWVKVP